jgi:hypothetical protein
LSFFGRSSFDQLCLKKLKSALKKTGPHLRANSENIDYDSKKFRFDSGVRADAAAKNFDRLSIVVGHLQNGYEDFHR